jgi:hypothetical protein
MNIKKYSIALFLLLNNCKIDSIPPNNNNVIEVGPINATGVEFLQVSNLSLFGSITIQGETNRSFIEVIPDLSAITSEQANQVVITAEINPDFPEIASILVDILDNSEMNVGILVLVPSSILEIEANGDANISASGLDGNVFVSSDLGNITLDTIQGDLLVEAGEGGDILGTNIFSPSIEIQIELGSVDIESFLPENGTIKVDATIGPGGPITLRVPVTTGASFEANLEEAGASTIISPNLNFVGNNFGAQAQGTIAGGGTRDILLSTSTGNIEVIGF